MERFSPKIEIINHFDDLIQRIDIDIEETLGKYNENQVLGELDCFQVDFRDNHQDHRFNLGFFEPYESSETSQTVDLWSESTKVVDYLKQIRMNTIEELRKEQKETIENSSCFNSLNAELTKEQKRSHLFAEKFYFQVKNTRSDSWLFNIYTFVTDFYMSQSDIDLLENLINGNKIVDQVTNEEFLSRDHIFDEKMVLIGLLYTYFCENLNKNFPNHAIHVFKQDLVKIERIDFAYDLHAVKLNSSSTYLTKLKYLCILSMSAFDYITIDGLSSLEHLGLEVNSVEEISFKNLYTLKEFYLRTYEMINIQIDFFDNSPNIETLLYSSKLMKLEFKKLEKHITISNILNWNDLNFDFFLNKFCHDIEKLLLSSCNIKIITKLFSEYNFPNLILLDISECDITRIGKKLFKGLPLTIQNLGINKNYDLETIDYDAFSDLKQLVFLQLRSNNIELLNKRHFSGLINLESLDLSFNRLKRLDKNLFSDLKKLEKLCIGNNELEIDTNSFASLKNLNQLSLDSNKLQIIDHNAFSNLTHLVSLDLSYNKLQSFDRKLFSGLINLESLNLSCNQLKRLDENKFSNLKKLKRLSLWGNNLEIIDANSFVGLENLNKLILNSNKLEIIDVQIFDSLPRIEGIYLSGNAISNLDEIMNKCKSIII